MNNRKQRPHKKSADLQRSPFFTVEDWRRIFGFLLSGEEKRDNADMLARCVFSLGEALDQGEYQVVRVSLNNAMIAAKEFGKFTKVELDYYKAYLLGDLKPEDELQFRTTAAISKNGDGARPIKKNH